MQPKQDNLLVYLGPITAIALVVLGCWWYFGMLKQRVREKPLAPNVEPWRPTRSPFPTDGRPAPEPPTSGFRGTK